MALPDTPDGTTRRRAARERAVALLYEAETKNQPVESLLAELPLRPERYTVALCRGVADHVGELDDLVRAVSTTWSPERMPLVDRLVLRLGVYELLHRPDVPTGVVLSEWVELASDYSTGESSRFVNGILSRIARDQRTAATDTDLT